MLFQRAFLTFSVVLSVLKFSLGDLLSQDLPCGPRLYCYPKLNTTLVLGTVEYFRWYADYPTLANDNRVDVRLYEMSNTTHPIMEWLDFENQGFLPLTLTSEYFPPLTNLKPNETGKRLYQFLVTPVGRYDGNTGPLFWIEDIPHIATTTATTTHHVSTAHVTTTEMTTVTSSVRPNILNSGGGAPSYTSGKAAGIVIGSVLGAILLGGIVIFAMRRNRDGDSGFMDEAKRQNTAMMSSDGLVVTENASSTQLSPLTENDAHLIADTYRESLRKPGWAGDSNQRLL
ncbi:hypothetical protein K493DRAFT_343284 [Basidiobolus meristosporus CBS 931.73]|uniref:Uncharacterized protein n=1 Tax=Basidiobolus meristosporus CBS 931.73 TaxID=1314790 RepID=A0A1Y1VVJ2_9FUNG|nr:hypothetical protein K493DRAFT_343284 [Basidiobolus meristosporus CBS 931.73]|eukprot:ORX65308.1 hypothetical protein K493DRAFT_343284 [Basidiobolus meristosporus CBS 931.73]